VGMMHDHVLVTAIYNYSPYSKMGGRGYDMAFYAAPFLNVIKLGLPIIVYTHENQINEIDSFFKKMNAVNYKLIIYDLEATDITQPVLDMKKSSGIIDDTGLHPSRSCMENQRNHVLCLKKPFFLKDAIEHKFFNGKHYYWIDAGLFHHGLFPEEFGGKEKFIKINDEYYWPNFKNSFFKPGLIETLLNKTNKNFIFMNILGLYGKPYWWEEMYSDIQFQGHVVGGIFGGDPEILLDMYEKFIDIMNQLLEKKYLILEEEILSLLYAKYYSDLGSYEFTTWQHDIITDPCGYELPENTKCFYKIFKV
jgi:hypothetical protein